MLPERQVWFGLALFLAVGVSDAAPACTVFQYRSESGVVVGRTFDWTVDTGTLRSNPRGMLRTGASARWVSRYGSVTVDQFGPGLPLGGMNEAGLVVEEASYWPSRPPAPQGRPAVDEFGWIQLQLDLRASVEELLAGLDEYAIESTGFGQHYLVADAAGEVAVIEFLDGDLVVHRGEDLPVPALANDAYERSVGALAVYAGFGGSRSPGESPLSPDRFARAARGLREVDPEVPSVDAARQLLSELAWSDTRWRVVHDLTRRGLEVSIDGHHWTRMDLAQVDLRCGADPVALDLRDGNTAPPGTDRLAWAWAAAGEDPSALERLRPVMARAAAAVPDCGGPVRITLVANAGVCIEAPGQRVFVDAFFDLNEPPSDKPPRRHAHLDPAALTTLERGGPPFGPAHLILATHDHDDHMTLDSVQRALRVQPGAGFAAPGAALGVGTAMAEFPEPGSSTRLRHGACEAVAIGVPHVRRPAPEYGHVAWLVHAGSRRVLHLGDASTDPDDLNRVFTRTGTVDAVVVPAWFLGEADALAAIGAELGDVPVVVVHVDPYERDAVHASARPRNWVVLDRPGQSLEVVGP